MSRHTPVLLQEVLKGLHLKREGAYIDATAGEGGHLKMIAKEAGKVLALERNKKQFNRLQQMKLGKNIRFSQGSFRDIEKIARKSGFRKVDGVFFDLGLSYWELTHLRKGFSFKNKGEELDMRLDEEQEMTAKDLLNTTEEDELYKIFSENSEEIKSREIAKEVVSKRRKKKVEKVRDLVDVIDLTVGAKNERTYARIFQALRMHVNNEKENLKRGLEGAINLLKKNGRLVVISFHSIEDRIVKKSMDRGDMKAMYKKTPSFQNRGFERSAILRVAEKIL